MSHFHAKNFPPMPTAPDTHSFSNGITTRVMATKHRLLLQSLKDADDKDSPRNSITGRRNSKFLSGTSIPNSTIRSNLDSLNKIETIEEVESSHSTESSAKSLHNRTDEDKKISEQRGMERMRKKIHSFAVKREPAKKKEPRNKTPTPLDVMIPQTKMRRSTLESIRNAIDRSPSHVMKLVNADSIEKRNVGQHFKLLTLDPFGKSPSKTEPPKKMVQKQEVETQTSLLLEKLLQQMRPTSQNESIGSNLSE